MSSPVREMASPEPTGGGIPSGDSDRAGASGLVVDSGPAVAGLTLVTGSAGYLGTHIVQQLLTAGHRVRASVRDVTCEEKVAALRRLCPGARHPLDVVEAELLTPDAWPAAVDGCTHVIHTASPLPMAIPSNEDDVIRPAVEGTLNVLRACRDSNTVKRVVLTSSIMAIYGAFKNGGDGKVYTEDDWTDPVGELPYPKSKALAEKAAWHFVENLPDGEKFELVVINPSVIVGPVLCAGFAASFEIPQRLLERHDPLLASLNVPCVDVRDVAAAHVVALTAAGAAGHRHVVSGENLWLREIAATLSAEFRSQGYNVPTRTAPNWLVRLYSLIDKTFRFMVPSLGNVALFDNSRMRNVLGVKPRDIRTSLVDMSYSMIENGMIMKTNKYVARSWTCIVLLSAHNITALIIIQATARNGVFILHWEARLLHSFPRVEHI